jgi:hypothetical protein
LPSAAANGQPVSDRDHLESCEHCQAEAKRWQLVADGIRAERPVTRRRLPVLAASLAAALVVIAGTGIGESVPLSYLASGMKVLADGPRSGKTITALHVSIRPGLAGVKGRVEVPRGFAAVRGKVTSLKLTGFTLVTAKGSHVTAGGSFQPRRSCSYRGARSTWWSAAAHLPPSTRRSPRHWSPGNGRLSSYQGLADEGKGRG